jgi:peptidoglycan/xylan/chitin deacetylase (PgdA/CDA1 family)
VINVCFHGIGTPGRELEPDEDQFWIEPERFEELLAAAQELRHVGLSFDDGNASDFSIALPALVERGLTASFFVISSRLGEPGSLDSEQVRALAEAGMEIGSHGMRHLPWRSLGDDAAREELDEARKTIEDASGRPVEQAACPFGAYDRGTLRALRSHGYTRVYTVDRRPSRADAWLQSRYVIRCGDTQDIVRGFGHDGLSRSLVLAAKTTAKRWR